MSGEYLPPTSTAEFAGMLARMEERIRILETTRRLDSAAFSGTLRMLDDAGTTRVRIGQLGDGEYGIEIYDQDDGLRFRIDGGGYTDPWLDHPYRNLTAPDTASTTSSSFVDCWSADVPLITHRGVVWRAAWRTDPGTTGEVRLRSLFGSGGNTSAVAIAAGSSGEQQFNWLHGETLGAGPVRFLLQVRRTGGSGNVYLDTPNSGCSMADPGACTVSGL